MKSLLEKCGTNRPTPNFVVDTHGKWYQFCSPGGRASGHDFCHRWTASRSKADYIETQYRLEAQYLTNITNTVGVTTLFVERSLNTRKELLMERKKFFLDQKNSNYIVLHADRKASIEHGLMQGHQSNAFALGDASAIFHSIITNQGTNSASGELDMCYKLHFKGDACFPTGSSKKYWGQYYWEYCATNTTSCRENPEQAEHRDTLFKSVSQSASLLIYGMSNETRRVLVVVSLLVITIFIARESKKTQSMSMPGIGALRFIASIHVVAGHFQRYGSTYMAPVPLAEFGYTWVPWFMILSAFILSTSTLNKTNAHMQPSWHKFVSIRIQGIYPIYFAGLLTTALSSTRHISVKRFMIDLFLVQAWYPAWTEGAIMPHSWFLSAIVPCWAIHNTLFKMVQGLSTTQLIGMCAVVTMVPFLCFAFTQCWWCDHASNHYHSLVDILVVLLKFHPISYLPLYGSGICLAHLLHRWKLWTKWSESNATATDTEETTKMLMDIEENISANGLRNANYIDYVFCYGCSLGVAGLLSSFILARLYHFQGAKLAFRLGCLFPWHALLLIGIAVGSQKDPVRKLFEIKYFQIFGNVSYCQYVFQFIWFHKWSGYISSNFWPFCVASSIIVHVIIDRPYKQKKWVQTCAGLAILTLLIYELGLPRFKVGFDSTIRIKDSDDSTLRWINPSIAWSNNETLIMSARRLKLDLPDASKGSIWSSDMGIGELKIDVDELHVRRNDHPKSFMRIIEQPPDVVSCHTPFLWVRGFEDPRINIVNESIYLTAVHHAQKEKSCVATPALLKLTDDWSLSRYHRLIKKPHQSTKNWMHLNDHLYMTDVATSSVVKVDPINGDITEISSRAPVSWLGNMHGGSNLLQSSSVIDGEKVWLGVIHSVGSYRNYLIEFEYNVPYSPRRLSKQIPLYAPTLWANKTNSTSSGIAFASGLAPCKSRSSISDCMIITYGSNDIESRAFVLQKEGLLNLFLKGTIIRAENS